MVGRILGMLVGCGVLLPLSARGDEWPQFRGPTRDGIVASVLDHVPAPSVVWKVPVPGHGWSQPVVVGQTVFLTTAVPDGPLRPVSLTAGPANPSQISNEKPPVPDVTLDWRVIAMDPLNGNARWSKSIATGRPEHPIHPSNTYATETPAADASAVYAFFGMRGTLVALDHQGQELWRRELGTGPVDQGFGTASSLAMLDGSLFVQCFRDDVATLIAIDTRTGQTRWQVERPEAKTSWSTPFVWQNGLRTEVIASAGKLITSHDPATGAELWRVERMLAPVKASISGTASAIFFGYRPPFGAGSLFALPAGMAGRMAPAAGKQELASQLWSQATAAPALPSPLVAAGCVYVCNGNVLSCHDAATGELHYRRRLPEMNTVAASPVAIGDAVVWIDEDGELLIVKAGPTFEVVARLSLGEMVWASPAWTAGRLLVRGVDHLFCVQL